MLLYTIQKLSYCIPFKKYVIVYNRKSMLLCIRYVGFNSTKSSIVWGLISTGYKIDIFDLVLRYVMYSN